MVFVCCSTQATIIDGKKIANEILKNLKAEVEDIVKAGKRAPCLTAILVGDNAASATYVRNKMVAAKKVGTYFKYAYLSEL